MAKLIGVLITGIKPFVEKIIKKEEGKDRWPLLSLRWRT